jgi:hypothetical protein
VHRASTGTEGGWQPGTFVSSRRRQRMREAGVLEEEVGAAGPLGIDDIVDVHDDALLGRRMELREEGWDTSRAFASAPFAGLRDAGPSDFDEFASSLAGVGSSKGADLLVSMGWNRRGGVGPLRRREVENGQTVHVPPPDVHPPPLVFKLDRHGLGFDPHRGRLRGMRQAALEHARQSGRLVTGDAMGMAGKEGDGARRRVRMDGMLLEDAAAPDDEEEDVYDDAGWFGRNKHLAIDDAAPNDEEEGSLPPKTRVADPMQQIVGYDGRLALPGFEFGGSHAPGPVGLHQYSHLPESAKGLIAPQPPAGWVPSPPKHLAPMTTPPTTTTPAPAPSKSRWGPAPLTAESPSAAAPPRSRWGPTLPTAEASKPPTRSLPAAVLSLGGLFEEGGALEHTGLASDAPSKPAEAPPPPASYPPVSVEVTTWTPHKLVLRRLGLPETEPAELSSVSAPPAPAPSATVAEDSEPSKEPSAPAPDLPLTTNERPLAARAALQAIFGGDESSDEDTPSASTAPPSRASDATRPAPSAPPSKASDATRPAPSAPPSKASPSVHAQRLTPSSSSRTGQSEEVAFLADLASKLRQDPDRQRHRHSSKSREDSEGRHRHRHSRRHRSSRGKDTAVSE